MMRLATFIIAILALTAAFAPITQGEEVRRAKPLTEMDLVFAARRESLNQEKQRLEANKAERRAIGAAMDRLNAQAAYIRSMPTSEYKIQAWDRLLAEQDRVSDWLDRVSRRGDNDQAWADQNEINFENQLAVASKHEADSSAQPAIAPEQPKSIPRAMSVEEFTQQKPNTPPDAPEQPKPAPRGLSFEEAMGTSPSPTPDQNDCLPFAVEALARLKKSSHWAEIAGFIWIENDKNLGGHAVVFYQPTDKTNVYMYDRSGSFDLQTRSHNLFEIVAALNRVTRKNLRVESPKWLESEDSRKDFGASAQQPVWANTGAMRPYQIGEGRLIGLTMILAGYAYLIVICFLKGKPGFGALGILGFFLPVLNWVAITGAIRIAKPDSRWARKRYGPEKMKIALQRFTPQPVQPPPTPPLQQQQQPPIANSTQENMQRTTKMVIAREWLTFVVLLVVGLTIVPLFLITISYKEVKLAMLPGFYEALFSRRDRAIGWLLVLAPYIIYQLGHSLVWAVKTAKGRSATLRPSVKPGALPPPPAMGALEELK